MYTWIGIGLGAWVILSVVLGIAFGRAIHQLGGVDDEGWQ